MIYNSSITASWVVVYARFFKKFHVEMSNMYDGLRSNFRSLSILDYYEIHFRLVPK